MDDNIRGHGEDQITENVVNTISSHGMENRRLLPNIISRRRAKIPILTTMGFERRYFHNILV